MTYQLRAALFALALLMPAASVAQTATRAQVTNLKVTVLSTMLVGAGGSNGIGEWGFAALVEADGRRILIDTGARPETVLRNVEEMRVDLSNVTDVVLTHNHADHTGGLLALRRAVMARNPAALSRVHVPAGIFTSRLVDGREVGGLRPIKSAFEQLGGTFIEHGAPFELLPGVWLLGPVPRVHPERNWNTTGRLQLPSGPVEDNVPEDTAIAVNTPSGLVVISGCGHAGIVNTLEYARKAIADVPIEAAIGGFHLFAASDEALVWTGGRLKALGVRNLLGAHCTGIEAVFRLRQIVGLARRTAVVAAVGSSFTLGTGIESPPLAR
ncbi:MAG: MBL fold metallo-hydrolase [Acidobacteriota bacterium]|nr:MBL fold metallo-hydrolase [Acidobacteriota bacterium]